jgi:hypothetical protein
VPLPLLKLYELVGGVPGSGVCTICFGGVGMCPPFVGVEGTMKVGVGVGEG